MENSINTRSPRPQPSLESHFSNWEIVFVFDNQPAPLSVLCGDPSDGDDPERMGGEFFLPEEKPIAAVGGSSAWSQLAAALKGGAAVGAAWLLLASICLAG